MPNLSASSLPCIGRSKTSSRRRAPGAGNALPRRIRSGIVLNRQFLPRPVGCQLFISPRPASPSSFSASSAIAAFLRLSLACIAISVLDSLRNLSATRQAAWDSVRIRLRAPGFILTLQLDSCKATVWAMQRQRTGTSSNNPQRDQNNQISHGYAERGAKPVPRAGMEALLHCTPSYGPSQSPQDQLTVGSV